MTLECYDPDYHKLTVTSDGGFWCQCGQWGYNGETRKRNGITEQQAHDFHWRHANAYVIRLR